MRMPRTSIAGLMGIVLVASLGLTALRSGSAIWSGTTFLVTCGVLALAVVGAVCRTGAGRAWWLGFAIFGWGYFVLVFWGYASAENWNLPTVPVLTWLMPRPTRPGGMGGGMGGGFAGIGFATNPVDAYSQAGHCLIALLVATLGGLLALGIFGPAPSVDRQPHEASPVDAPPRRWWRRPVVVVPASLVVASGVALIGLGRAPGYTAAAAFFATWCLLGLAVVGAVFGPRGRRAAWLGAALFGIGYMGLIFRHPDEPNWPHVATDRLLRGLREWFPRIVQEVPDSGDKVASNARILKVLDEPIPMRFPNETPLEDVLKAIQAATRGPDDRGIPIYVDPLGLQEAEKTMQAPILIDVEGVPLRSSLNLALRQLGLTYQVGGGLLTITCGEGSDWTPFPRVHGDPFLVVGHCLLALLAAGLGGMLGPRVCK
jgi:hypothetical protein